MIRVKRAHGFYWKPRIYRELPKGSYMSRWMVIWLGLVVSEPW